MDLQQAVIVLTDSMGQHVKLIFHSVRWTHARRLHRSCNEGLGTVNTFQTILSLSKVALQLVMHTFHLVLWSMILKLCPNLYT